jgi:hypothetical protein
VGVFDRDFAKPNECNGFTLISRNCNDLASSNFRRRFRPFAGVCRFFYFNPAHPEKVQLALVDDRRGHELAVSIDLHAINSVCV